MVNSSSPSTFSSPSSVDGEVPRIAGTYWLLALVSAALLAMAAVPVLLGERTDGLQSEIVDVLEPARTLGSRLTLLHARQMSRFQAFLLTGDRSFRIPYQAALGDEQEAYGQLQALVRGMDLTVREGVARLSSVSEVWHAGHQAAFASEEQRIFLMENFDVEQRRYTDLQQATLQLEDAIRREVNAGRYRMDEVRRLQGRIQIGLILVVLIALVGLVQVARDLRNLTRDAQARRREAVVARRDMDALQEATSDGVLSVDLEGKCVTLNRAGSELLGYLSGDLRGRDLHDALHHTGADRTPRAREASVILGALRGDGIARSLDDVFWRKDGSALPVQWSLRPLMDGRVMRGGVLTFSDMSELRAQEAALRRAVQAREDVVAIVSHDLRNPLGVVSASAELLLELPLTEDEVRSQAEVISRSAQRMRQLTEDLLDVSKMEAGALSVDTSTQDPRDILDDTILVFGPQARAKGIRLTVAPLPLSVRVKADRSRVLQALANLVGNALKFTPIDGEITLFAEETADGRVALGVSDTGQGIPEEALSHLFDRFWQVRRHDRTGAGLGLAIVKGIAEAHGGDVSVESTPGAGTTFRLVLSRPDDPPAGAAPTVEDAGRP